MSDLEKEDRGIEDEHQDSTFSVNRVVIENIEGAITREDMVVSTEKDLDLTLLVEDVMRGKLSERIEKTLYGKVFEDSY